MEHKTSRDAVVEAINTIKPVKEKYSNRVTSLIKNAALIITLLTILSIIILYAYNTGVLGVYNIPSNYISINLQNYIPILIQFCGSCYCFVLYYIQFKSDELLNKTSFNFLKLVYSFIISWSIVSWLGFEGWGTFIVALSVSVMVEIIYFVIFRKKKEKQSQEEQLDEYSYKQKVENYINDALVFLLHNETGIIFIVILVLFAPSVGSIRAHNQRDYELLNLSGENYVIVVDYLDSAVIQKATVVEKDEKNELIIDVNSYQLISKENISIEFVTFEKVKIKEEK